MYPIEVVPWLGCREPFSSLSHLIGAAVVAGLAPHLIRRGRGNTVRVASLWVLAIASFLLLTMSGVYHVFSPGPMRNMMLRADVTGVFILIAASMTPSHAILFRGWSRWGALTLIWLTAILGIASRLWYWDTISGTTAILYFLVFGWASVFSGLALWRRYGWSFIQPAVLSGLCYTVGAIILADHRLVLVPGLIGPHEIWHVAVLFGLALQWRFVWRFASGQVPSSTTLTDQLV